MLFTLKEKRAEEEIPIQIKESKKYSVDMMIADHTYTTYFFLLEEQIKEYKLIRAHIIHTYT